jgi:hypothetical protein
VPTVSVPIDRGGADVTSSLLVCCATTLALAGCGRSALDAHRQRWSVERRALEDQLDVLEERLVTDQARVRFWREMRDRHESVTAVACENLDRHAQGMAVLDEKQRDKMAVLGRKNRVAVHFVPTAEARP